MSLGRLWAGFRPHARSVAGIVAAALAMLIGYGEVVFAGKTFTTGLIAPGLNGSYPPPGQPPPAIPNAFHSDPAASAWAFEPWGHVVHQQLSSGHLPLWNPYQAMGTPLLANMQSAVLDPFLLPVRIIPTPLGWDIAYLIAFGLGGIAMFLYCRSLGLRDYAAVAGAATFVLSGWFILDSNNQFFRSYLYLPAIFLAVDLVVERPTPIRVGGFGLVVALNLVTGMPEASFLVLMASALYAVWRVCVIRRAVAITHLGVGWAFGFALAAPQLLLFIQYLGAGHTTHESQYQTGLAFEHDATRMLSRLLPFLRGNPFGDYLTGGHTGVGDWSGCAVAVLALAALAAARRRARDPSWFMVTMVALIILKYYGVPGIQLAGNLPVFNSVAFTLFAPPIASFGMAVLAAVGIDALADGRVSGRRFAVLALIGASGLVILLTFNDVSGLLHSGHRAQVISALLVGGAAIVVVCLAVRLQSKGMAGWVAAGAAIVELALISPHGFYQTRFDTLHDPSWVGALAASSTDRIYGLDGQVYPNTAGVVQRQDIRSLDAIYVQRYMRYVDDFVQPSADSRFTGGWLGNPSELTGGHIAGNPMFDLLGVRYVFADASQPDDQALPNLIIPPSDAGQGFTAGGDQRLALVEPAGQEARFAVADPTPGVLTLNYALSGLGAAPLTLAVDGISDAGRMGLWRESASDMPLEGGTTRWQTSSIPIPGGVRSIALRLDAPPRAGDPMVAWNGVRIGPYQYRRLGKFGPTTVFENTSRLPRAFVVHSVHTVKDEKSAEGTFAAHSTRLPDGALHVVSFDPRREAVVEGGPELRPSTCSGSNDATIVRYEPEQVVVDSNASCPGLLILTDTVYPGWSATVNGRSAPILPTDIAFRGVVVPAGHAETIFSYRPSQLTSGGLIAGISVLVFGCGSTVWVHRRRSAAQVYHRSAI